MGALERACRQDDFFCSVESIDGTCDATLAINLVVDDQGLTAGSLSELDSTYDRLSILRTDGQDPRDVGIHNDVQVWSMNRRRKVRRS